jgi:hypothetical protein
VFAILEPFDFCFIALIVMIFAGSAGAYAYMRPSDEARMRRLEDKVDLIIRHLNIEYHDPRTASGLSAEVCRLADNPETKIQAIKLHRQQTGLGLKEAKDAVEAYIAGR